MDLKFFWGVIKARVTRAPTPRPDLSHAHSYFPLAVAAMDNCYTLIGVHQPTLFIHRPNSYAIKFRPVDKEGESHLFLMETRNDLALGEKKFDY